MASNGVDIFRKNYPNIYGLFNHMIDIKLSDEEQRIFFDNLSGIYTAFKEKKNIQGIDDCYNKILSSDILGRHHLFKFLLVYPPNSSISPPCVNELEEALGNSDIIFEDKKGTIASLMEDRIQFWGTYCEFEIANNLTKVGCQVKLLKKDKSLNKYPDIEVIFNNYHLNVEVSNRHYELNKDGKFTALINKINDEAEQLPKDGINVIIIFVSQALLFSDKIRPERIINVFDFSDIVYEDSKEMEEINLKGKVIKKPKRKLILYTRRELQHISALAIWYYGQVPLEAFGRQRRMLNLYPKDGFPREIIDLFNRVQERDVK